MANRQAARRRGICPATPYRESAPRKPAFFPQIFYKGRARIEQGVGKIKLQTHRLALREDGTELCRLHLTRLHLCLGQIRPHSLVPRITKARYTGLALMVQAQHEGLILSLSKGEARLTLQHSGY